MGKYFSTLKNRHRIATLRTLAAQLNRVVTRRNSI